MSITLNSISKYKVRVLPSLIDYYVKFDQAPEALCFGLASLLRFYVVSDMQGSKSFGEVDGRSYPIQDDRLMIKELQSYYDSSNGDVLTYVKSVLSDTSIWDKDLNDMDGVSERVSYYLESIFENGMSNAMTALLNKI